MDDLLEEMDSFHRSTPADRARRRRLIATAGICGLAFVGIGQLTTGALFADTATAGASYATGNVSIEANASASTTLAAITNMAPGDTNFQPIAISNVGSLDLRYAITGQTTAETNNLSKALLFTIYSGVKAAACTAKNVSAGTAEVSNLPIGTTSTPVLGSNVTGQDPKDRVVNAGDPPDELCVVTSLPLATDKSFANATASVKLTFDAEQTKNN